jgi:hypothetical protein
LPRSECRTFSGDSLLFISGTEFLWHHNDNSPPTAATALKADPRLKQASNEHGLCASTLVVLPEENQHEYEELLRGFRESFQPENPAEHALVLRLAQAHWRSLRSRRVETGILGITANAQRDNVRRHVENCPDPHTLNPHEAIAVAFMTMPAEHWQMYLRYDTTVSRDFFKTLDALTKLQRTRQLKNDQTQKTKDCGPGPRPAAASQAAFASPLTFAAGTQLSENGTGFVSQNSPIVANCNTSNERTASASADSNPSDSAPSTHGEVRQSGSSVTSTCIVPAPANTPHQASVDSHAHYETLEPVDRWARKVVILPQSAHAVGSSA